MGRIKLKSGRPSIIGAATARQRRGLHSLWLRYRLSLLTYFLVLVCLGTIIYPLYDNYRSGRIAALGRAIHAKVLGVTKDQGLVIEEILVDGRNYTDKQQILDTLQITQGMPILGIDLESAQSALLTLPWVKDAKVERRLPGTMFIHLTERHPLAIWQNKGALNLIDETGSVILGQDLSHFAGLLVVVGPDAPSFARELVDIISMSSDFQSRVQSAVRIGQRRWDLHLKNDMIVKLPEKNPELAVQKLLEMHSVNKVLDLDYAAIDMRLADRIFLQKKDGGQIPAGAADKST
ncbi:MAG: FtsQ-type POTRA domain-containing protein [Alphaproteobacteria bacterium]|nr:MAG: FtsQ-type POTRA domain-containing protein [Alphaproteobacteria bacterium]